MLKNIFVLLFLSFNFLTTFGNVKIDCFAPRLFPDTCTSIEVLREQFGKNKIIPKEIEKECLIALSHFPELAETPIEFIYSPIKFTMQTQPKMSFLFHHEEHWRYKIQINDKPQRFTKLDFKDIPFLSRVGWVGHELSHIIDYQRFNVRQMIRFGIGYGIAGSYRKKVERRVDKIAIHHGLGRELYCAVNYMQNFSKASEKYKAAQKKHYLSLSEIDCEMECIDKK